MMQTVTSRTEHKNMESLEKCENERNITKMNIGESQGLVYKLSMKNILTIFFIKANN